MLLVACVVAAPALAVRPIYTTTTTPSNRIFLFSMDPASGALTWVTGFVFPLFTQTPSAIVVGRDATHAYAAFSSTGTVGVYSVDSSTGYLSAAGPPVSTDAAVGTGTNPAALAVSPNGTRLFVANSGSHSVSEFPIQQDGSLGSPALIPTGTQPSGLAITPDGTKLYVANTADDTISAFSIDSSGGVHTIDLAIPVGDGPTGLAVTPNGRSLYATNAAATPGNVSQWSINADGSLTSLGDPAPAGTGARSIAVSSDGTRALVTNPDDSTVSRYVIGSSGALTSMGTTTTGVPTGAMSVAISPDGKHAYVGGTGALATYDLSTVAGLTQQTTTITNASQTAVAIAPDQGPQAKLDAVAAPATVASTFEAGASQDSDGSVATWDWDFGDGSTATGHGVTHTYAQPGTYTVTVKVTDDEGCSTTSSYTGQSNACVGSPFAVLSKVISVGPAPVVTVPDQECGHDGNDGFCGTPDQKAPQVTILGVSNGASINDIDAPTELVGSITPDPSGIQAVKLRFKMAAGTIRGKKTVRKKVCRSRKVHGKKRRTCKRKKVTVRTKTKVPACKTVSGTKNYLVLFQCSKVPWVTVPSADGTFRYDLPVALGIGSYTLEAIAIDGAGNSDVLEQGRNSVSFKIVKTPANTGTGAGNTSGGTTTGTTTTPPPVNDTGSPF